MKQPDHQETVLYSTTKCLLSKVEQQIVRVETRHPWLNHLLNNSFFPFMFLAFGIEELFRPLKTWFALFIISTVFAIVAYSD